MATGGHGTWTARFVSLFTVFDENASRLFDTNLASCGSGSCDPEDEAFRESNLMHGINGLVYGNDRGYEDGRRIDV